MPLALFDRWDPASVEMRSSSFDVLVVVTTYNEADIVEQLLERLTTSGIRVHVIDNWSTDATPELIDNFVVDGAVTWERFPADGASGQFELERLLQRVEVVAADSGADWVIHHDADEIRESPWPGVSLIDALWAIEQWGYNCIDHTVFNFRPIDNSWSPGGDLARSFEWCEFGDTPADFLQIKGWKPQSQRLAMAHKGGHEVKFPGRRVFPYKFLLRHYPIRSQEHGERKIFRERRPRWSAEERAKGWHVHYDHYNNDTSFLWNKEGLLRWGDIDQRYLLQRLSGVGMPNNPWLGEGVVVDD
jgi:glycosyltransferase involved in cell wall biosynthesis